MAFAGILLVAGCGGGGGSGGGGRPPTAVAIAIDDVESWEGDGGTTALQFTVSITESPTADVTVDWATSDGTATLADSDYVAANGRLVFTPAGTTTLTINVLVNGDSLEEPDETFFVSLSDVAGPGAAIADDQGQGTIRNDDVAPATGWPEMVFAPYVDMGLWPLAELVQLSRDAEAAGAVDMKYFVMAFLTAGGTKTERACWAGQDAYEVGNPGAGMPDHGAVIAAIQAAGGDVMVSFGGAIGTPLAANINDVDVLVAEYERVITTYDLTCIDFDIEGLWVHGSQAASIDRRSQAMKRLQDNAAGAGRSLEIWLTLPVLPTGLTADGIAVVTSAVDAGVDLAGVNVMCMNYGPANYTGDAGESAILAGTNLFDQLETIYANAGIPKTDSELWSMVGLTPMIGVNDLRDIVFTQADAAEVLAFAEANAIGLLSMWSSHRDHGATGIEVGEVSPTHSGLDAVGTVTRGVTHTPHGDFDFTLIFSPFTE